MTTEMESRTEEVVEIDPALLKMLQDRLRGEQSLAGGVLAIYGGYGMAFRKISEAEIERLVAT